MKKVFTFELEGKTCAKCPLCLRDYDFYYCLACNDDKGHARFIDAAYADYDLREIPDWCPCTTIEDSNIVTGRAGRVPVIDKDKCKKFIEFLNRSGKTKEFWDEVKRVASTEVDKDELDKLFASKDEEK